MTIKLYTSTTHHQQTKAVLTEAEIHELLAQAVAAQAGIDLSAPCVTWRAFITSRNGSTGSEKSAEVVITQDMSKAAKLEEPPRFVYSGSVRAPITIDCVLEWCVNGVPFSGAVVHGPTLEETDWRINHINGKEVLKVVAEADEGTLRIIG